MDGPWQPNQTKEQTGTECNPQMAEGKRGKIKKHWLKGNIWLQSKIYEMQGNIESN